MSARGWGCWFCGLGVAAHGGVIVAGGGPSGRSTAGHALLPLAAQELHRATNVVLPRLQGRRGGAGRDRARCGGEGGTMTAAGFMPALMRSLEAAWEQQAAAGGPASVPAAA